MRYYNVIFIFRQNKNLTVLHSLLNRNGSQLNKILPDVGE